MIGSRQGVVECPTEDEQAQATVGSASPYTDGQAHKRWDASEVTLFDRDWLSAGIADSLAECQQDWIGLLQPDWKLELYNLNLLGFKGEEDTLKHSCWSVTDLVFLIRKVRSQPLTIFHQQHWGYSSCLQIAGLGRVRLVVCFNNPQCFGHYAAFTTNRLDWSPRRIVTHWTQRRSAAVLSGKPSAFRFYSEGSLQLA